MQHPHPTVPDAAGALAELRRQWYAEPDARPEIEHLAAAVKLVQRGLAAAPAPAPAAPAPVDQLQLGAA